MENQKGISIYLLGINHRLSSENSSQSAAAGWVLLDDRLDRLICSPTPLAGLTKGTDCTMYLFLAV